MNKPIITTLALAFSVITPGLSGQEVAYPTRMADPMVKTYPYSMAGQVIFSSGRVDYQGSATVVHKRSALTAAHNLWDPVNGWSSNVEFNRARSGRNSATSAFANRIFVFGGYQANARAYGSDSLRAFAFDLGGVRFPKAVADGGYAGWRADTRLLTQGNYNVALGYGADHHSGDELLYVEPPFAYEQIFGAFLENDSLMFEGGMSGGPVFADAGNGDLRVVGVVVAGSDDPPTGGVRAINAPAARFLNTYLRY